MTGIRLPDPMYGRYAAASDKSKAGFSKSKAGFSKSNNSDVSFGLPVNASPKYAPKYDINNEPVSTLRTTNNVPQPRFLGRNAYFTKDNMDKETTNQPMVVNRNRKIGVTKKFNEINRNKIPVNYDSVIYRNLNNTIGSDFTEKISSLDSFEYKYYRTNDPDQLSDFVIDNKDINNFYGEDNGYKHEMDKQRVINYALLQKLRNAPRIIIKDKGTSTHEPLNRIDKVSKGVQVTTREKKKQNKSIANGRLNFRSDSQNIINNPVTTDYDKIRDEITITTTERVPIESKKMYEMDNEYIDNQDIYKYCNLTKDELFNGFGSIGLAIGKIFSLTGKGVLYLCSSISDNTESLFETEAQTKVNKDTKRATKYLKDHEKETDHNEKCKCHTNKQCNDDYSNLPDLHINYETTHSDDGMYHDPFLNQNRGVYINGSKVDIDPRNRRQRHFKVDMPRQVQSNNYKYENRYPEIQVNYKRNNQYRPNDYYDQQYLRNNYNRNDYYSRIPFDQPVYNNQSYNEMNPPNLKIDYDTEIEEYDYEVSSKNTFDPDYPQFPNQYNNQFNNRFNNQPGNHPNQFPNQFNGQYNSQPNGQFNNQFTNTNNGRQREMPIDVRDGRIANRMDNMRNVNEFTFDSTYNLNRPQYENVSSDPTRFNTGPIVQEPVNMIPTRIMVNNPPMIPEAYTPRLMDLKKEVTSSNGFDKYKTVDIVEKSKRNNLSVSSSGRPILTAYGTKDGSQISSDVPSNGESTNSIQLPRKDYQMPSVKSDFSRESERSSSQPKSVSYKDSNEETNVPRNESRQIMDIKSDMNKMFKEQNDELVIERVSVTESGTERTIDRISLGNSLSSKGVETISVGSSISSKGVDTISIEETESSRSNDKSSIGDISSDEDSKKKNKRRVFPFLKSTKIKKEGDSESK